MGDVVVVDQTPPAEPAEMAPEAATEIAAIEAERDIAVATIEAETNIAAIEAAEVHDEWRAEIEALRASQETNAGALSERLALHETQIAKLTEANDRLTETVTLQAAAIAQLIPTQPLEDQPSSEPPAGLRENPGESETQTEHTVRKRRWM